VSVQIQDTADNIDLGTATTPSSGNANNGTWTITFLNPAKGGVKNNASLTATVTDAAGNTQTQTISASAPAGVAGNGIALALVSPTGAMGGPVAITADGLPSNWTLNSGTRIGSNAWQVQANDPASLTVTTPTTFVGATVLQIRESWINTDGSTASAYVADNVEAYTPGSPIFALSGDDNLTGSTANDLFVFAQPIGNDTVFDFDPASDTIDLIGFTGIAGFSELHIADDTQGNAVITIGTGESIALKGVGASELSASNFVFDQEPITQNPGAMTIAGGAILPLGGTINNTGTIALQAQGDETDLEILVRGLTLQGRGEVMLSDNSQNVIFGGTADSILTNLDNMISGAGQLGAGQMTLVNAGVINANGTNALVIDTGINTVDNSGTLEATGSGGLTVNSAITNSGLIWADGGNIVIIGGVGGAGSALISGQARLEFMASSHAAVSFQAASAGTLQLDQSANFTGTISGFAQGDTIDLTDIGFGNNSTLSFAASDTGTEGILTVGNGSHTAVLALAGPHATSDFQMTADGLGATLIQYHAQT
jgi:hypothetical protein